MIDVACRYITRRALANEPVHTNAARQVVLKLKTPWRDGATHLVMSPLEFMAPLAVPVTRLLLATSSSLLSPLKGSSRAPNQASSMTAYGRLPKVTNARFAEAKYEEPALSIGQLWRILKVGTGS